ncbi:CheY chemotaxis protein or a CheY-like REC (receiver) domain [Rhizobium sp. RU20A]|uniref:response regulator n=1 Tax=Rhizobium sp. RU20A TaxID=1907412 RepID=UPI000955C2CF|nr:response regulator [Rhizobium sp. RU20A]SIQ53215.1 CheY chemotaxis protein or a CheY-like REC (receiver) domain [Rhizobium sp. RU20A]
MSETAPAPTVSLLLVDDDPNEDVILRRMAAKVSTISIVLHYRQTIADALDFIRTQDGLHLVLMDNRLHPTVDFRETVPALRQAGFIGPIGVISSSLDDPYFQAFEDYGVDFRIDKSELDATAIEFLIREYVIRE